MPLRIDRGIFSFEFQPSVGILARDFDKLGLDIRSFREPLTRSIRQVMIPSFQENFAVGGRPAWDALSEATLLIRERQGKGGSQALVKSGALRRNMGFLTMWEITPTFATIKDLPDRIWYGKLQQAGFRKDTVNIPARPFVVIQDEDIDAVEAVFTRWLEERIAAHMSRGL